MTDKKLQSYYTYQRFIRTLLTVSGCWYMPTKSGKSTYYWTVCVFSVLIMYEMVNLRWSYNAIHNLAIMVKCIGVAISTFGAILKIGVFLINRGSLINYHRTLNDLFEEEHVRNEKFRTIMVSSLPTMCILAYTYSAFLIGVVLAFLLPTYLFIIREICHFHLSTNYTLPVSKGIGYFWTVPHNFSYHLYLLFETVATLFNSLVPSAIEGAFGFYVYQIVSIMRAMIFRLTNPLPAEKFSDLLRTCVVKHQKLLRCRDTLEHVYGPIVSWHIVSNAVLLCALIYEVMSFSDFNVNNVLLFLTYAGIKLMQTFIYAWCGTVLTNAGEDFRKGIYFSEWPNSHFDRHTKTYVILVLMQEPMTINAFYSRVDMNMFTNFVNATTSYFFLLQSVGDKGE